ncbi:unnamed protein product, partial [marine sediment metagenome]
DYKPVFDCIELTCHCGHRIKIPYLKGNKKEGFNMDIPMSCGHRWKGKISISTRSYFEAYYTKL